MENFNNYGFEGKIVEKVSFTPDKDGLVRDIGIKFTNGDLYQIGATSEGFLVCVGGEEYRKVEV
jgi:hypothetical protein